MRPVVTVGDEEDLGLSGIVRMSSPQPFSVASVKLSPCGLNQFELYRFAHSIRSSHRNISRMGVYLFVIKLVIYQEPCGLQSICLDRSRDLVTSREGRPTLHYDPPVSQVRKLGWRNLTFPDNQLVIRGAGLEPRCESGGKKVPGGRSCTEAITKCSQ